MEYVRGESLRQAIGEKSLTFRKSLELASQIAEGLAKAHERGVVHRDLKPENVLLSEDGYPKIIGFGLAKLFEPVASDPEAETVVKTREGVVMGSVPYMSPEQAQGQEVDERSDIFSFGTIFYEMLSGTRPFHGESPAQLFSSTSEILHHP